MSFPDKKFATKLFNERFFERYEEKLDNEKLFHATEALFLASLADQIHWSKEEETITANVNSVDNVDLNASSVLELPSLFKVGENNRLFWLPHLVLENKIAVKQFTNKWYESLYLALHEFVEEPSSSYRMTDLVSQDQFYFTVDEAGQMVNTKDDFIVSALTLLPPHAMRQVIKNGIAVIEKNFGSNAHVVAAGTFIEKDKKHFTFNHSEIPQKPVVVYQREYELPKL